MFVLPFSGLACTKRSGRPLISYFVTYAQFDTKDMIDITVAIKIKSHYSDMHAWDLLAPALINPSSTSSGSALGHHAEPPYEPPAFMYLFGPCK